MGFCSWVRYFFGVSKCPVSYDCLCLWAFGIIFPKCLCVVSMNTSLKLYAHNLLVGGGEGGGGGGATFVCLCLCLQVVRLLSLYIYAFVCSWLDYFYRVFMSLSKVWLLQKSEIVILKTIEGMHICISPLFD